MQGHNFKRTRSFNEYVISLDSENPLNAKGFTFHYNQIIKNMIEDDIDLSYDDSFTVTANEEEIVFRTNSRVS